MSNHLRPVEEQRVYEIIIEIRDFPLDKAMPQGAAAIKAEIDCNDAGDDFIKEKPHSKNRSSSPDFDDWAVLLVNRQG